MRPPFMPTLTAASLGLGLTLVGLTLAGLTALPAAADTSDRIRLVNINGYTVIDDEHVVLKGGASRHYLVTLQRRCFGLRFGQAIATSFGATATVANPRFEYITTGEHAPCYIDTIEQVEDIDTARALIAERDASEDAAEGDAGS